MAGQLPELSCDLMIIGTGMSGMAAAVFASEQGIDTIHVGMTGELNFASGLLDLLAVHPIEAGKTWENPWEAIHALVSDLPEHPYAKIKPADIRNAFAILISYLKRGDLSYYCESERNIPVMTPAGTLKYTYAAPATMANGIRALQENAGSLLIDFFGMKGFSGRQIAETLKVQWPALQTKRLAFPGLTGELLPQQMAKMFELPKACLRLAEEIRPHLGNFRYIGLPAILGIHRPDKIYDELSALLDRPVFEIPTMPPAIGGLRLRSLFERDLPGRHIRLFSQHKVLKVIRPLHGDLCFEVGPQKPAFSVRAKGAILATGRFFGKGLHADRKRISETIFGLPVYQPEHRSAWHNRSFFFPEGHRINRAGLEIDEHFRPLNENSRPAFPNLFAAGSILAHQDWKRMKCGSGLAIGSAFAAINAFNAFVNGRI